MQRIIKTFLSLFMVMRRQVQVATINKVRLTNVVYEDGNKRFNDEVFHFNGANSAIVLENCGGKTVFIHTVLQAILPHTNLGDRKIKDTLQLENAPAHIGIEWITNENPLRYVATVVTLFTQDNKDRKTTRTNSTHVASPY